MHYITDLGWRLPLPVPVFEDKALTFQDYVAVPSVKQFWDGFIVSDIMTATRQHRPQSQQDDMLLKFHLLVTSLIIQLGMLPANPKSCSE